jgi:hypothetical protein
MVGRLPGLLSIPHAKLGAGTAFFAATPQTALAHVPTRRSCGVSASTAGALFSVKPAFATALARVKA